MELQKLKVSLKNIMLRKCFCGSISPTIRNAILNYNKTVQSIMVDDESYFSSYTGTCHYERCPFSDKCPWHIITRDLKLVLNPKIRTNLKGKKQEN